MLETDMKIGKYEYITALDAAIILKLDLNTIRRHLKAGVLVGYKIGGVWRIPYPFIWPEEDHS